MLQLLFGDIIVLFSAFFHALPFSAHLKHVKILWLDNPGYPRP